MTQNEINNRFIYHKPIGNQPQRYEGLRSMAKQLAELANAFCPESREKSHGMTQLEDAVMWFNASIARNENDSTADVAIQGMTIEQSAAWAAGYAACREAMKQKAELVKALQEELCQLCYSIERMPASEQQTALSLEASKLTDNVYKIVQAMAL